VTTSEEYEQCSVKSILMSAQAIDVDDMTGAKLATLTGIQHAVLAVAVELRRSNDQRDTFNASLLEFFERLTEDPYASPEGPSGASATAQEPETAVKRCMVCGREGGHWVCLSGELTRQQWLKHHEDYYRQSQEMGANKVNAAYWADDQMEGTFGPEPDAATAQVVEKEGP
jgi:hypothetical protein